MAALPLHERRCGCCTGRDGLGIYHFGTRDALRRFLATDHESGAECDIATVPGEPWGMCFVTAGEAEAWLDEYDERERAERFYDTASRGPRR